MRERSEETYWNCEDRIHTYEERSVRGNNSMLVRLRIRKCYIWSTLLYDIRMRNMDIEQRDDEKPGKSRTLVCK